MIWNNECRKIRRLLALWAGCDLDERDAAGVERHLAVCPQCRDVRVGLHQSLQALDSARPEAAPESLPSISVWPGVSRHIRSIDELSGASGWRDWLPSGVLAAACVAMISVLLPPVRTGDSNLSTMSDPVPVVVRSNSGGLQQVFAGSQRFVNRSGGPPLAPPADPDSYRNF